jgi:hypothetical protein
VDVIRRFSAVAVVALALIATGSAAADDDGGSAHAWGAYSFSGTAAGSFFDVGPFIWGVKVREDGSVRGHYWYRQVRDGVELTASGPITCAVIIDNHVWVGGTIEESSRPSLVGLDSWFQAQDNGHRKKDPPDMSSTLGAGPTGAALQYCVDHPPVRFPFDVAHGDLKVRD